MCSHFSCGVDVLNSTKRRNETILAWIYCWGNRINDDEYGGTCRIYGEEDETLQGVAGKLEGRKETTKCMCGDYIKIDLKETDVRRGVDLRGSGQGHVACLSTVKNCLVPQDERCF